MPRKASRIIQALGLPALWAFLYAEPIALKVPCAQFIKKGKYVCGERKRDKTCFYRFTEPESGYPSQIELLSRSPDPLAIPAGIRKVHIDDDVSSLSAIILDEKYYGLLENGCEIKDGIRVLKAE